MDPFRSWPMASTIRLAEPPKKDNLQGPGHGQVISYSTPQAKLGLNPHPEYGTIETSPKPTEKPLALDGPWTMVMVEEWWRRWGRRDRAHYGHSAKCIYWSKISSTPDQYFMIPCKPSWNSTRRLYSPADIRYHTYRRRIRKENKLGY